MIELIKIILLVRQSVYDYLESEAIRQKVLLEDVVMDALAYYIEFRRAKLRNPKSRLLIDDQSGVLQYLNIERDENCEEVHL